MLMVILCASVLWGLFCLGAFQITTCFRFPLDNISMQLALDKNGNKRINSCIICLTTFIRQMINMCDKYNNEIRL